MRPDDQRASQSSSDIAEGDHQTSLGNYAEIGVLAGNALGQLTSFGFDGLPPIQRDWLVAALQCEATVQTMVSTDDVAMLRGYGETVD